MHRPLRIATLALLPVLAVASAVGLTALPAPAHAQAGTRAYAPENLRTLSRADQSRVIAQEYADQARGARIPDDQLQFYLDQVNRSNWGFSQVKQDIATSLAGGNGPRPPVSGGNVVRCESVKNRRQECPVSWRSTSRLSRSLSNAPCVEGSTWGSTPDGVWVTAGCRAEFVASGVGIRPPVGGSGGSVTCGSVDNRRNACAWDRGLGKPRLVRQLSSSACREGQTWGYEGGMGRGQLWVDRGCRGEFAGDGSGAVPNPGGSYSVTCASEGGREKSCAWEIRRGQPRLIEQLSATPCVENRTWGYRDRAVWVKSGCRARFGVR